ncbi:MAG: serine/threonine protein kinase, partial [Myxococcales bacterium]|nr:serine/threonine protein kinase [Myxococcales bacterium]
MEVGTVVAKRFRLEQQVGTGGFGRVYRATDMVTGQLVAAKILFGDRHVVADRLAREVQVLTLLDHPGIVRYVDHGPLGSDDYYLVMEWLDGEDLAARLARESLTLSATLEMMTSIADALSHAHARQIIHRDIKPANVFLPRGAGMGAVKLVDFGIAKPIERRRARGTRAAVGDPSATGNP